jgi:hypothetical protein
LSEKSGGVGQKVGEHIGWKIAPPYIQQGKNQRAWAALMGILICQNRSTKCPSVLSARFRFRQNCALSNPLASNSSTNRRLNIPVRDYLGSVLPGLADFPINRVGELTLIRAMTASKEREAPGSMHWLE